MRLNAIIKANTISPDSHVLQKCIIHGDINYQNRTIKVFKIEVKSVTTIYDKSAIDPRFYITLKDYLDSFTIFSADWHYDPAYINWLIKEEINATNIWIDSSLSQFMHRSLYSDPYGV